MSKVKILRSLFEYLVTSGASRLERLGVMTSAVQPGLARGRYAAVEVDEIDQQFGADAADETLRMPVSRRSSTRRRHRQFTRENCTIAL